MRSWTHWFLSDLAGEEHLPLPVSRLLLSSGCWELGGCVCVWGGSTSCAADVCGAHFHPYDQWKFSLCCLSLAFSQIHILASHIANLPFPLCEYVTYTEVLTARKCSALRFPDLNFSPSCSPTPHSCFPLFNILFPFLSGKNCRINVPTNLFPAGVNHIFYHFQKTFLEHASMFFQC